MEHSSLYWIKADKSLFSDSIHFWLAMARGEGQKICHLQTTRHFGGLFLGMVL
jgi:hypothetical protein